MKFNISKSSVAQNGFKLLPECIDKNGLDLETARQPEMYREL